MKKFAGVLLVFSIISLCLAGAAPAAPAQKATRVVKDQMGNEIVIPEKVERVVISSVWPLASVYCLYMGSTEKLVGLDPAIISAAENSALVKVFPDIVNIPSGFAKNGNINAEELIKLKPDVVLYASGGAEDYEVCTRAGIPAIGFSLSIKGYNAIDTINSWIELLGEIMQRDFDTTEFMKYAKGIETMVADRLKDVPEDKKPRGMVLHLYDDSRVGVPSGTASWANFWITAGGGVNVAANAGTGTASVSMEQVYEWNPERIFITNFNPGQPDDLYGNKVGNYDWSSVDAVKNKRVYKMPLGMYRWYVCNADSPLTLLWMAKQNHPDLFADVDLDGEIKSYYKRFYNLELSDEDLSQIYNPSSAAAAGI
ncbi:MAG: ABC transporter substrate-binding protein [Synergistaceae bacterium]|jgi:iron complex transport system substrate-binding protein|nr:ABC transporter substrate-binding protein [Synergistaceae bacterium]